MNKANQLEFKSGSDEPVAVSLENVPVWIRGVVAATISKIAPPAGEGHKGFYETISNDLRVGITTLVSLDRQLTARKLEPIEFEREVQLLIDKGAILIPDSKLAAIIDRLRMTNPGVALIAQAVVAGIDVLAFGIRMLDPSELNAVLFGGLTWGSYLKNYRTRNNELSLDRLSVSARADLTSLIGQEIANSTGALKGASELAISKITEETTVLDERTKTFEELKKNLEALLAEAPVNLKRLEEAYRFEGSIRAAFEHWDTKANEHRRGAKWYLSAFVGVLVLWVAGAGLLAQWLTPSSTKWYDVPFSVSVVFVLIALLGFWIGRLLVKQYMSERHLAEDAAERSALIKTFVSMIKGGEIAADRTDAVLSALFRSAATGLLTGDGSPVLPMDLINKALDRVKA